MSDFKAVMVANPWQSLRQFTPARIALGRSGVSLPTAAQLDFQLAHARARDAVHARLDAAALALALTASGHDCRTVRSAAQDRNSYLQRPDLGRRLDAVSRTNLERLKQDAGYDLVLVIADGLSALAIEENVQPFLAALLARLAQDRWSLAPTVIVSQGRVAVGDEVAQILGARAVLMMIGERPGLSSPDSMGLYLTWAPRVGTLDAGRNCISNVRSAGMGHAAAASKAYYLLSEARKRGVSGIGLKDETAAPAHALHGPRRPFLTLP